MNSIDRPLSANAPLIDYTLKGLELCWLPRYGRWSHIYHLDSRTEPNESLPRSDVFYTLNVLLGLSRVPNVPAHLDLRAIFERNVAQVVTLPTPRYALGMDLWSSAVLGVR